MVFRQSPCSIGPSPWGRACLGYFPHRHPLPGYWLVLEDTFDGNLPSLTRYWLPLLRGWALRTLHLWRTFLAPHFQTANREFSNSVSHSNTGLCLRISSFGHRTLLVAPCSILSSLHGACSLNFTNDKGGLVLTPYHYT